MAESIRDLRRLLHRIENDISESQDRIRWYEERVARLTGRREELLTRLDRSEGDTGNAGGTSISAPDATSGDPTGGLAGLLANISPETIAQAAGMLGPLLAGLGGSSETDVSSDSKTADAGEDDDADDVDPPTTSPAAAGLDPNLMNIIARVASSVGGGGGGAGALGGLGSLLGGGGGLGGFAGLANLVGRSAPAGNPLDGVGEILDFFKAGHFKNKTFSMDDAAAMVKLAGSPGVRSLVGVAGQLAAGVAALNQLRQASKTESPKAAKKRKKGLTAGSAGESGVNEPSGTPGGVRTEAAAVPPEFRLQLTRRAATPPVARHVASRLSRG